LGEERKEQQHSRGGSSPATPLPRPGSLSHRSTSVPPRFHTSALCRNFDSQKRVCKTSGRRGQKRKNRENGGENNAHANGIDRGGARRIRVRKPHREPHRLRNLRLYVVWHDHGGHKLPVDGPEPVYLVGPKPRRTGEGIGAGYVLQVRDGGRAVRHEQQEQREEHRQMCHQMGGPRGNQKGGDTRAPKRRKILRECPSKRFFLPFSSRSDSKFLEIPFKIQYVTF
jgi:hypothetical protein